MLFVFGAALVVGALALFSTPRLAPLLQRWRYSYWIGTLAADAHRVLLGPRAPIIFGAAALIHVLTILVIWLVGRAQGLALPVFDCAVLFTVMVGVALAPISVGGWGLRELAVVSLLGAHGLAPERALIFSVCFGLVAVIGVLPGLVAWLLYPLPRLAAGMAGRRRWRPLIAATVRSVAAAGAGSSVPFTSITSPRPPSSRRQISGQPAAR